MEQNFKDCFKIKNGICYASFTESGVLTQERAAAVFNDFVIKKCKGAEVVIGSQVTAIDKCAFYKCLTLTRVEIQEGVSSIGDSGFAYCKNLESITLPHSIKSIGKNAFYECYKLEELTLPEDITIIDDWALACCIGLKSLTLPEGLTRIGYRSLDSATHLEEITIPQSVESIGFYAFEHCKALTIRCQATEKPEGWHKEWNHSNRPVLWGQQKIKRRKETVGD